VSIDDKVLGIGWYAYEHALEEDPNFPDDRVEVSGHDVAGSLLYAGSSEYAIFSRMFRAQIKNYEAHCARVGRSPVLELPLPQQTPNTALNRTDTALSRDPAG
jgi:hypothetical protein